MPRDAFWAAVREIAASIPAVLSERKNQLVKTDIFLTKDVTCKHTEEKSHKPAEDSNESKNEGSLNQFGSGRHERAS